MKEKNIGGKEAEETAGIVIGGEKGGGRGVDTEVGHGVGTGAGRDTAHPVRGIDGETGNGAGVGREGGTDK